jgi:arylsulfatase A-like enzyme
MMTGLYPQQHGAVALDAQPFRENVIGRSQYPTLPQLLDEAGYLTELCGKSHLGDPKEYGFRSGAEHKDYNDIDTFAYAERFIDERRGDDTPFFLWLAPHQPHVPLKPDPQWLEVYANAPIEVDPNFGVSPPPQSIFNQGTPGEHFYRDSTFTNNHMGLPSGPPRTREQILEFTRAYYATISHLDHQVGKFVARLTASGHYSNTLIFFLADNGYHLGNHGLGNKITMHEESVRVPMFVHWSGLCRHGVRTDALVSSLDVYPTVLELAGAGLPTDTHGTSLVPLFRRPDREVREYVASECVGVGGKLGQGHRMVRTQRWKYVLTDVNEEWLFDERADPYELTNLSAEPAHQRTLALMRQFMAEWMARVGDTHAPPSPA